MQHAGVRRTAQRLLQHSQRFEGVGARRGFTGFQIPQQPGCAVNQGFGKQRRHIGIVGKGFIDIAHRRRVGIVPGE
ncbi:hypothetical protein D3C79_1086490 [compost metagenome]